MEHAVQKRIRAKWLIEQLEEIKLDEVLEYLEDMRNARPARDDAASPTKAAMTVENIEKRMMRRGDDGWEEARFLLEASDDSETEQAAVELYFRDLEDLRAYASVLDRHDLTHGQTTRRRYDCVWLYEYGCWKKRGGKLASDWIYIWWSAGVKDWGDLPEPGSGFPFSMKSKVEYRPCRRPKE